MSGPTDSGKPLGVSSDPTNAMLSQFLQLLQRRKVLWEFKLGVAQGSTVGNTDVNVLLDGDDNPIVCRTLIGPSLAGLKVAVIFVPPTGYYIVGTVGANPPGPLGVVAAVQVVTTGGLTTTSAAETDITQLHLSFTWSPLRMYEIIMQCGISGTVATDTYNINCRRDTAITGATIGSKSLTAGGIDTPTCAWLWVPTVSETVSLFFSHVRRTGTGTFSAFGSPGANASRTLALVKDIGPANVFTTA